MSVWCIVIYEIILYINTNIMDQVNYPIVIIVVIAVIILLVWIIRRNQKDEKKLEQDIIQSELKPEENNDKEIES